MVQLSVSLSPETLRRLSRFEKGQIFRNILTATHKAGLSAARKVRRESQIAIQNRKTFSAGFVSSKHYTTNAPFGAKDPSWKVEVDGQAIPVGQVKYGKASWGVLFSANQGSVSRLPGAFVARMPNGHIGVFLRDSRGAERRVAVKSKGGRTNVKTLPIREVFTSGVSSGLNSPADRDRIMTAAGKSFERKFVRIIKLDGGKG